VPHIAPLPHVGWHDQTHPRVELLTPSEYHKTRKPIFTELLQMKTTIEMPDDLFRRAKAVAALQGLSMKDWLTNLLRKEVGAGTMAPSSDQAREQEADAFIQELNQLASDISAHWTGPQDAVASIREQRRDLGA
jgi:predicted lipoprotein